MSPHDLAKNIQTYWPEHRRGDLESGLCDTFRLASFSSCHSPHFTHTPPIYQEFYRYRVLLSAVHQPNVNYQQY